MGSFVVATASSLQVEIGSVKLTRKDFVDSFKEQYADDKESEEIDYESIYFDILQRFEFLTSQGVRFVFLIDDLDRCLPENVLKMLESIKLFLDVQGCAFVLAVDDEIVERGVEHHYRHYKDKDDNLPITGFEYLEKMINLPFKLPTLDIEDIRAFLESHAIFDRKQEKTRDGLKVEGETRKDTALVGLFTKTVPPVPRKLIRAINLFSDDEEGLKELDFRNVGTVNSSVIISEHVIFMAELIRG